MKPMWRTRVLSWMISVLTRSIPSSWWWSSKKNSGWKSLMKKPRRSPPFNKPSTTSSLASSKPRGVNHNALWSMLQYYKCHLPYRRMAFSLYIEYYYLKKSLLLYEERFFAFIIFLTWFDCNSDRASDNSRESSSHLNAKVWYDLLPSPRVQNISHNAYRFPVVSHKPLASSYQ